MAEPIHVRGDDARSGTTPGIVRYILIFSLGLAIGAMSLTWIIGAMR